MGINEAASEAAPWSVHGSALFWIIQIILIVPPLLEEPMGPVLLLPLAAIGLSLFRLYFQYASARLTLIAIAVVLIGLAMAGDRVFSMATVMPAVAGGFLLTGAARQWVRPPDGHFGPKGSVVRQ